jgi:AraC family transcriptional regulator
MPSWHLELRKRPSGGTVDIEVLKRKSWPGIAAEYVRIAAPETFDFSTAKSSNHIILHDLYRIDGRSALTNLPPTTTKDLRNKLTYAPIGCDYLGWCQIDKSAEFRTIRLDPTAKFDRPIDLARLPPRLEFEDRMLRSVLLRFQAILDDPSLDTPGYAEALGDLLAFELQRATLGPPRRQTEASGLSPEQVRRITEYMESHLAEKTTISELAALVDLTRFHFIRSFKKAAGIPPHQFLIQLRIDRAKELLSERSHSIADVAVKTGFGSAIQLSRAFRRVVGTTPTEYRREF